MIVTFGRKKKIVFLEDLFFLFLSLPFPFPVIPNRNGREKASFSLQIKRFHLSGQGDSSHTPQNKSARAPRRRSVSFFRTHAALSSARALDSRAN